MTVGESISIALALLALAKVVFDGGRASQRLTTLEGEVGKLRTRVHASKNMETRFLYDIREMRHDVDRLSGRRTPLRSERPPPTEDEGEREA